MISRPPHIVVLTGAGVSAESGIPTFRDSNGLWMGYDVYEVASPRGWKKNPALVLDFYNARRRDISAAHPNEAHTGLAAMESDFKVTVITQNIDDLHERGGSSNVLHLHGEIFKKRSEADEHLIEEVRGDMLPGERAPDGTAWRPHIVWFEEPVPLINQAAGILATADVFILIGSSLQVYPAAGLIHAAPAGIPLFIIDKKIPALPSSTDCHLFEMTASEGVRKVSEILKETYLI
jgi:NAD-dependent deacetylase